MTLAPIDGVQTLDISQAIDNSVLPLPAPAEQTQCTEAGGEERKGGGQRS